MQKFCHSEQVFRICQYKKIKRRFQSQASFAENAVGGDTIGAKYSVSFQENGDTLFRKHIVTKNPSQNIHFLKAFYDVN